MSDSALADLDQEFAYTIAVSDAGPATKKIAVEIPQDRIETLKKQQFQAVRREAHIPGFRPGHAPVSLLAKKFEKEIQDQVRQQIISESYQQAVQKNELKVVGEPEFAEGTNLDKLPTEGGLKYELTVEVQPAFDLPNLEGLEIKKPKITVTETNVDQAMQNLREQQGALVPVEGEAQPKDFLVGDFHLKEGDNVLGHQHGAQLVVANGRVAGIEIPDLESKLVGIKPGDTKTLEADVPADFPQTEIAGKKVSIEIKVNDIKRLEPAVIDADFLESLGFADEKELREALREQLVERINFDVAEAQRNQVRKYILDNTNIELPTKMTGRQSDRVVQRRAIDLMQRGVPEAHLRANLDSLRQGASDEATRDLKLFFVLARIAEEREVEVDESELNGRIAMMAAMRGERPEKLKQQMAKDGSLQNLYLQLREQKALDTILDKAKIEETEVGADKPAEEAK
jgi:trigger factor